MLAKITKNNVNDIVATYKEFERKTIAVNKTFMLGTR